MNIVFNQKRFWCFQTFKCFVFSKFIQWDHLKCPSRYNLTILIYLSYNISKSIKLCEPTLRNFNFTFQKIIDMNKRWNSISINNYFIKLSSKNSLNLIKQSPAIFCMRIGKLSEFHTIGGSPEVGFLCKTSLP